MQSKFHQIFLKRYSCFNRPKSNSRKIDYCDRHSLVKLLDRLFSTAGLEVLKLLMMPKKSFQIEMFKQPFVRSLEFWTALFEEVLVQQKLSRRVTLQLMVIFGHDWSWVRNQQQKEKELRKLYCSAQEWDGQNHLLLQHHILNKKDVNNKRVLFSTFFEDHQSWHHLHSKK